MGAKKRVFRIEVNGGAKAHPKRYQFDYGGTKGIRLMLSANSATIEMLLGTKMDAHQFLSPENHYLTNALQKTMIAWLLVYGRANSIRTIELAIDGMSAENLVDTMEIEKLRFAQTLDLRKPITMAQSWGEPVVMHNVLGVSKSKNDPRMASLAALALSKTKAQTVTVLGSSERFIYLWTAINGYCNYLKELAIPYASNSVEKGFRQERNAITLCLRYHGWGDNCPPRKANEKLARITIRRLEAIKRNGELMVLAENNDSSSVAQELQLLISEDAWVKESGFHLTSAGNLTFCLPYYFRCGLLHGDRSMPVFVRETDERYWCLALLNTVLEGFLDTNLWLLFDQQYVDSVVKPQLAKLVAEW